MGEPRTRIARAVLVRGSPLLLGDLRKRITGPAADGRFTALVTLPGTKALLTPLGCYVGRCGGVSAVVPVATAILRPR